MNSRDNTQWQASGIVYAPVAQVWQALLETQPMLTDAMRKKIAGTEKGRIYSVEVGEPGNGRMTIEVDPDAHRVAVQGEWWYRGVHSVKERGNASLVTYSIFNVAPGITRWMAQLVQGPEQARAMKGQLAERLTGIGERLGCKTEMLA